MKSDDVVAEVVSLVFAPCRGPAHCGYERFRGEFVACGHGLAPIGDPCEPCSARIARHMVVDILATLKVALGLPADCPYP